MGARQQSKEATRRRIIEAAVESLIEVGYASTTTVEVQRRAGISRGALLHHFPTREQLAAAAIGQLVVVNENVAREALADAPSGLDPLERAFWMLRVVFLSPSMRTEFELWSIARVDDALRRVLRDAEREAQADLLRVADLAFGPDIVDSPNYPLVLELTIEFLRGLSISGVLRGGARRQEQLLATWVDVARDLLEGPALEPTTTSTEPTPAVLTNDGHPSEPNKESR